MSRPVLVTGQIKIRAFIRWAKNIVAEASKLRRFIIEAFNVEEGVYDQNGEKSLVQAASGQTVSYAYTRSSSIVVVHSTCPTLP